MCICSTLCLVAILRTGAECIRKTGKGEYGYRKYSRKGWFSDGVPMVNKNTTTSAVLRHV